jgi:hypothetical protein
MSVAPISTTSTPATAAPAPSAASTPATATPAPSADYKTANVQSSQTTDNDGDLAKAASAPAQSTDAVQAFLSKLRLGG